APGPSAQRGGTERSQDTSAGGPAGARSGTAGLYRRIHHRRGPQSGLRSALQCGGAGIEDPGQWRQPSARRAGRRPIVVERATGAAGRVVSEHMKSSPDAPAQGGTAASAGPETAPGEKAGTDAVRSPAAAASSDVSVAGQAGSGVAQASKSDDAKA